MLDVLTNGFRNARLKLQGRAELNEDNIKDALREVRTSLIQADVEIGVVRDFIAGVREKVLGQVVAVKAKGQRVTPQDHFIKCCYDELVELMGGEEATFEIEKKPAVIMMVGLQGSGKTTTSGKLAKYLMAQGHRPMLVAADIYRPAAVNQLMVLGRRLAVPVFSIKGMSPVKLATLAVGQAKRVNRDVVIIDTAGRLAIDNELMQEVVDIREAVKPEHILFVCDAMMGQDAVRTAAEFDRRLDFSGFVVTKLDGDARGGAALAIRAVTGKGVKFLGQGEGLDALEVFRPEGLAQRILGMGDIVGLVQDFEKHVDKETAEKDAEKILKGTFTYDDFIKQLKTVRKMGPLREIMAKMPFMSELMHQIPEEAFDDGELDRTMAIIGSMTKQERRNPDVMNPSRFTRVAGGCGRDVGDVKDLHERFLQAREMMKGMGSMLGNPAAMARMQQQASRMQQSGMFPGMPGMGGFGGMGGMAPPEVGRGGDKAKKKRKKKLARKSKRKGRK